MRILLLSGMLFALAAAPAANADVASWLATIDQVVDQGPFKPAWDSLEEFQVPDWYRDGKFGIFIHWGVYSVPAFGNEWYPRNMYLQGSPEFKHHLAAYGPQNTFGYKDFIAGLTAGHYDAAAWARLFAEAGAKFVVPVAEHHDGFAMYDCSLSDWTAAKMGPKRDLIGELAAAVRAQGLVFGLSSHRAEHWWFFDGGMKFDSDVRDPKYAAFYGPAQPEKQSTPDKAFLDDWLSRTCELVDKYQPQLVWFDWWIEQPVFEPYRQRFAAFYYNRGAQWNKGVAINYKNQSFPDKAAVLDIERGQLAAIRPDFWQTDTSVSKNSWGYIANHKYKTAGSIVDDLIDIVSKNGALLLNIGPRPDGTIPEPEQEMLREIGKWLALNGEAIYGSRPWKIFGEGPTRVAGGSFSDTRRNEFIGRDIRFTCKGDTLYAIILDWPDGGTVKVKALASESSLYPGAIGRVELLGHATPLEWTRNERGLLVRLPAQKPCEHAFVLRITPDAAETPPRQSGQTPE